MLAGNGVELELTDAALDFLSQVGYDPEFGARPVKGLFRDIYSTIYRKNYWHRK